MSGAGAKSCLAVMRDQRPSRGSATMYVASDVTEAARGSAASVFVSRSSATRNFGVKTPSSGVFRTIWIGESRFSPNSSLRMSTPLTDSAAPGSSFGVAPRSCISRAGQAMTRMIASDAASQAHGRRMTAWLKRYQNPSLSGLGLPFGITRSRSRR